MAAVSLHTASSLAFRISFSVGYGHYDQSAGHVSHYEVVHTQQVYHELIVIRPSRGWRCVAGHS